MSEVTGLLDALYEIRQACYGDLQPATAANYLNKLSSLYGTLIQYSVHAEMRYNRYYEKMSRECEKITEARVRAKASSEYESMLKMQGYIETAKELIRSLKYLLKVKLQEQQEGVYA